jgi:hypothetical protein
VSTVKNAGHVRFLDAERIAVLGHRDTDVAVLDVRTGQRKQTWWVPGALALGHALPAEKDGTLLLTNSAAGRLVRLGSDDIRQESPPLVEGVSEASLPE